MDKYLRGKLTNISTDLLSKSVLVTFAVKSTAEALEDNLASLRDKELLIGWEEYSENRGLNANAYFHVLCREIGKHKDIQRSETYVKNRMIAFAGQPEVMDGEDWIIKTTLDVEKMWESDDLRVKPAGTKIENGKSVYFYKVMRKSRTYTVKEMAQLIDETVRECHELGIPTMSQKEADELLKRWRPKKNG